MRQEKEFGSPQEILVENEAFRIAMQAAMDASQLILQYWPNPSNPRFDRKLANTIFEKSEGVGNYATLADIESEKAIITAVKSNPLLKEHSIVSEESDEIVADPNWQWVIDPIDGTPPFKNGLPEFGISIGLLKGHEPIMGVIAMPASGQLIAARKNQGAALYSLDGELISPLNRAVIAGDVDLKKAMIGYDLGYRDRGKQLQDDVAKIADKLGYPVSYGSSSTAAFRVAQGLLAGYFFRTPTKFDIAATSAIIPEIGGKVTDFQGQPIDWQAQNRSIVIARNPQIHDKLLEIIHI